MVVVINVVEVVVVHPVHYRYYCELMDVDHCEKIVQFAFGYIVYQYQDQKNIFDRKDQLYI